MYRSILRTEFRLKFWKKSVMFDSVGPCCWNHDGELKELQNLFLCRDLIHSYIIMTNWFSQGWFHDFNSYWQEECNVWFRCVWRGTRTVDGNWIFINRLLLWRVFPYRGLTILSPFHQFFTKNYWFGFIGWKSPILARWFLYRTWDSDCSQLFWL